METKSLTNEIEDNPIIEEIKEKQIYGGIENQIQDILKNIEENKTNDKTNDTTKDIQNNIKDVLSKLRNVNIDDYKQEEKEISKEEKRKILKQKLKQKINNKRSNRTIGLNRKKSENLSDSMKKITEILVNKGITKSEQIDANLLETLMGVINKQDLQLLMDKLKDNTIYKEVLNKLQDKYNE